MSCQCLSMSIVLVFARSSHLSVIENTIGNDFSLWFWHWPWHWHLLAYKILTIAAFKNWHALKHIALSWLSFLLWNLDSNLVVVIRPCSLIGLAGMFVSSCHVFSLWFDLANMDMFKQTPVVTEWIGVFFQLMIVWLTNNGGNHQLCFVINSFSFAWLLG